MQHQTIFKTRFIDSLVGDHSNENHPRQVLDSHYSFVNPVCFPSSQNIAINEELSEFLGISDDLRHDVLSVLSLKAPIPTVKSFAMCYGGHQFGNWAGQLGDGRAINLGDIQGFDGVKYELQLKGAGPTPYSRTADGYAVLRSSIREYLCSEAMFHLGVPTTRALSLSLTGESVLRDIMYNGNPMYEPGATVCRVAKSFIRFGNFELLASRQERELLLQLIDFCINEYFPSCNDEKNRIPSFFKKIADASCHMVVEWMRVGFVHGVMNTDNMSILGDTIDYGPYGWIDNYDPNWTPNTTDLPGRRYCFGHQPFITQWNLMKLANALAYIAPDQIESLKEILNAFESNYQIQYRDMMLTKIGLSTFENGDLQLIDALIHALQESNIDMTIFFRNLANISCLEDFADQITPACYNGKISQSLESWLQSYVERLKTEKNDGFNRKASMDKVNPKYVLRNYMAQIAIDAAYQGDYHFIHEFYELLTKPYDEQIEKSSWFSLRPDWAINKVGCSMLSCSS